MPDKSRASLLVAGAGASAWTGVPKAGLRVRPGERPNWLELQLTSAEVRELRQLAAGHPLPLDVWLSVLVEYKLTRDRIAATGEELWSAVVSAAEVAAHEPRLPPTAELRDWLTLLQGEAASRDELPSVVLPMRLVAQLPHERRKHLLLEAAHSTGLSEAITLERAAAASGRTLETWAYQAALAILASSPRAQPL